MGHFSSWSAGGMVLLLGATVACGSNSLRQEGAAGETGSASGGAGATSSGGANSGGGDSAQAGSSGSSNDAGAGGTGGSEFTFIPAGTAGKAAMVEQPPNYQVSGSWPERPVVIETQPGTLSYTKIVLDDRYLAQSCAIGDYDGDGLPDVSSGRRWYQQGAPASEGEAPTFVEHIFRGGHDELPRLGESGEIYSGDSDDFADYAVDMDLDGDLDIIDVSNVDISPQDNPNPAPEPQRYSSAYWYENPGAPANQTDDFWVAHLMHGDVRGEHHGLFDIDGDGGPELFGACRRCEPNQTMGYYSAKAWPSPASTAATGFPNVPSSLPPEWVYHPVVLDVDFPFGGTGKLHGQGFGDVNGDGVPDLMRRDGIWLDALAKEPNQIACPGEGCGFVAQQLYNGLPAPELGPSHMYATDLDGDGDADIVAALEAHHEGLAWYEQTEPLTFVQHRFMGTRDEEELYGVYFSQPHALEVVDMDGDGVPDIVTGKSHFTHPIAYNDPDALGDPVLYVFKTVRDEPGVGDSPITLQPVLIDSESGVGHQIAAGHVNTDGIMDLCIASKLGLFVFLGQ